MPGFNNLIVFENDDFLKNLSSLKILSFFRLWVFFFLIKVFDHFEFCKNFELFENNQEEKRDFRKLVLKDHNENRQMGFSQLINVFF